MALAEQEAGKMAEEMEFPHGTITETKENANRPELWENTEEELRNTINVLQLLMTELTANYDDPHILRSVGIAEGMLQTVLSNLLRLKTD